MQKCHGVRLDLIEGLGNGTDDDPLVAPLSEVGPDTVHRAAVHTVPDEFLALFQGSGFTFAVGDEARVQTGEGIEQIERLVQAVPVQVLHHRTAEKAVADPALHEVAVDLAGPLCRPQPDMHAPVPLIPVHVPERACPALVGALKRRVVHEGMAVEADQRIVGVHLG